MNLTIQQAVLFEFVKRKHGDQKRKYTGEPYYNHLMEVAEIASVSPGVLTTEIAFCHDLFEDTPCTVNELYAALAQMAYADEDIDYIVEGAQALTDKYTSQNYPALNRAQRKNLEAIRLSTIPPHFQTIKYADLISNTSSIVDRDPGFGVVYLDEKEAILQRMTGGYRQLYWRAISVWYTSNEKLKTYGKAKVN